jgi:hypothetical protein
MPTPVVLAVTSTSRAGVATSAGSAGDATNGHSVVNDGSMWVEVDNSAGTSGTVTFAIPALTDGQAVAPKSVTIPLTSTGMRIGPFPVSIYGQSLIMTESASTLTVHAYHLG